MLMMVHEVQLREHVITNKRYPSVFVEKIP